MLLCGNIAVHIYLLTVLPTAVRTELVEASLAFRSHSSFAHSHICTFLPPYSSVPCSLFDIPCSGRICGNSSTSWIEGWLVSSMQRRSMPKPMPDVGGMPYSRAL